MCTVTYIPGKKNVPVILTSNRDESTGRKQAREPVIKKLSNNLNILSPIDLEAGGSWIAASEKGRIVCLLNGAFEKHIKQPPYRMSRGVVFMDNFLFDNIATYAKDYLFDAIEPFTLVIIETFPEVELYELRWDGKKVFFSKKEEKEGHIWSSPTLYNKEVSSKREQWFNNLLTDNKQVRPETMLNFHSNGGSESSANERINVVRPDGIETVSTTQIIGTPKNIKMLHLNRLNGKETEEHINLKMHVWEL